MLIDTHCHLNDPLLQGALGDVLSRARLAGVEAFVVPAYDRASLERTAEVADGWTGIVHPAFGLHPWYVGAGTDCTEVFSFLERYPAVALGEIGLDAVAGGPPFHLQMEALTVQLDVAVSLDMPVIIHCRRAHDALLRVLKGFGGRIRGVMHSFSGSGELMECFLDLGLYIAFSGSVTRRTARKYQRNAASAPLERLLVETDAPSIATESTVASEVEPRHAVEVARKLAELRGMTFEELSAATTANARRLFGLP